MSEAPRDHLTLDELYQMLSILNGGTPGDLCLYQSGTTTRDEMLAYFAVATDMHEETNLYALGIVGAESGGIPKAIAITGNGPDAAANARRLGLAAEVAPRVVDVLARFVVATEAALSALADGDTESAKALLGRALEGKVAGDE